jgi:hypothetical protein
MEAFLNSIKCTECKCVLEAPVLLPCGHSICKKHANTRQEFHCVACDTIHVVPQGGFYKNIALEQQLSARVQEAKFCAEYERALCSCRSFETSLQELGLFLKDPHYFINKTIGQLKMDADVMREEFKQKIDQIANELIRDLEGYEEECKRNLNVNNMKSRFEQTEESVKQMSPQLDEWKQQLAVFGSSEAVWTNIREKSEEERDNLEAILAEYKDECLLDKLVDFELKVSQFTKIQLESNIK